MDTQLLIIAMIYDIAGLRILIKNEYSYTTNFCKDYLSKDQSTSADIIACVKNEEMEAEKKNSSNFSDGYIENICLYRSICMQMPRFNRMLLHGSILEYEGAGYAFLGRSGTGKSTHTKLWLQNFPTARIINGDKPILEYRDGKFIAYGTPWMGKERWGVKASSTLKGLCFLEQAKENVIAKLSAAQAATRLFTQILLPEEEENASATLELADKLVMNVPAFLLKCDISQEAVKTSFEALTGQSFNDK